MQRCAEIHKHARREEKKERHMGCVTKRVADALHEMVACHGVLHKPPRCHVPVMKHSSSRDAWACMHGSREEGFGRWPGL
jgi:hypothetical protein